MNLDEQLRAALNLEAEMRIAPPPDADSLISGGQARRRRRNAGRLGLVAAAVVLVGGGAYAVTQIDSGNAQPGPGVVGQPSQSSEPTTVAPGNREVVGVDNESGLPISIVVPENAVFGGGTGVTSEKHHTIHVGLEVFQARTLAGGSSGCIDDNWLARGRQPADTAQALGRQLERLPRSTLIRPLTPTTVSGYDAFHLRLRVNNGCPAGKGPYLVAEAESDFGLDYGHAPTDVVIDFLVVDVHGTPIVIASWHQADASTDLVHRATRVRNSITFVTGQ